MRPASNEALKLGLISMDSTIRSNLGVGLPIDLVVVKRDALKSDLNYRIDATEPYFHDLRERWSEALRAAHKAIPLPPYRSPGRLSSGRNSAVTVRTSRGRDQPPMRDLHRMQRALQLAPPELEELAAAPGNSGARS